MVMTAVDMIKNLDWVAAYGAVLATVLALVQLVRWLLSLRPSLDSTYSLLGHESYPDRITIANLRPVPLMVSSWRVEWVPTFWRFWIGKVDQTPEFEPDFDSGFVIPGHSTHDLKFTGENKLDWSFKVADKRKLRLSLRAFGRQRPITVTILRR